VRARERILQSSTRSIAIEPLVMQLLVALSRRAGELVTRREIFELCWGSAAVGDDSLNRIVAVLRKALLQVTGRGVTIETISGAGYVLRISGDPAAKEAAASQQGGAQRAIDAAFESWRLGLPEPDHVRMEQLRAACRIEPTNASAWGMLSLLCRHAAEYGGPGNAATYARECERAARRAIELDAAQPEAQIALTSIVPLFGGWAIARERLSDVLSANHAHLIATQDLATLEMATGRVRSSKRLRDSLVARDPLAAVFCYKAVYQHWSVGDLASMDHLADRAIQLWPTHPAVWMVRLWTLAFTGRVPAAIAMLDDSAARPSGPFSAIVFLRQLLSAVASGSAAELDAAVGASLRHARTGPANAMAAMFALGLIDRRDELFNLTEAYYLRDGTNPIPVSHTAAEFSLNEHHRRLTQVLFTPVFEKVLTDPRFLSICDRIGLTAYWEGSGLAPDFLA
jgi:DNA-binding winged helix-turn-helix (wHTH) protein